MRPTTNIQLIDVLNSLSDDSEREKVFEILKNSDPINEDVQDVKFFLENNNYDYRSLQEFIDKPKFENLLSSTENSKTRTNYLKYVAIFVGLISFGSYFIINSLDSSSKLYSKYYQKDVGLPVLMSDKDDILFKESMNAYKDEDYETSLRGFEELLINKPNNDTLHYFSGLSNLELDRLIKSISHFEEVDDRSIFKEKSEFRLSLVYLKRKEFEKCKMVLEKIIQNEEHQYYSVSKEMLGESVFD
jgi:tetratricopeptide (TPR) repeat protein